MVKKFLSASAVAALVFAACSTDDGASPFNSAAYSSSSQGFDSSSSTLIYKDSTFLGGDSEEGTTPEILSFSQNECSIKKLSDNTAVLDMMVANYEKMTLKMTLVGSDVEMDMTTTYDVSVSEKEISALCAESNESAVALKAAVTCEGRSITVKYKDSANGRTIDEVMESGNELCDMMKLYKTTKSSSSVAKSSSSAQILLPPSSSSAYIPPSTENGRATCDVLQDTDNAFKMVIVAPDSVTMTFEATYQKNIFTLLGIAEFAPNIPQSVIDQECAKSKAEAAEDDDGTIVTCNGNVITEKLSGVARDNIVPLAAPTLIAQCDIIQATGVIPEDDEDF